MIYMFRWIIIDSNITEVANHFKGVDFTLPFSRALKQQTITGTLSERLPDAKYRSVAAEIAKAVI